MNWQNKLSDQNLNSPYLVLYNSSAKDANSTIVERSKYALPFLVENATYYYATINLNEGFPRPVPHDPSSHNKNISSG